MRVVWIDMGEEQPIEGHVPDAVVTDFREFVEVVAYSLSKDDRMEPAGD